MEYAIEVCGFYDSEIACGEVSYAVSTIANVVMKEVEKQRDFDRRVVFYIPANPKEETESERVARRLRKLADEMEGER
jgi:hypothetical protein